MRSRERIGARTIASACMAFALCAAAAAVPVDSYGQQSGKNRFYFATQVAANAPSPHRELARQAIDIYQRLSSSNNIYAQLVYSPDSVVNAAATHGPNGERVIIVYGRLLHELRNDPDAIAAIIGHELGHHQGDHMRQGRNDHAVVDILATLAGLAIDA